MQLPTRTEGKDVFVEFDGKPLAFRRSDFRSIQTGPTPLEEWPERLEKAARPGTNSDERFKTVWWAVENGLSREAALLLRSIHIEDPKHQPTARMVQILDELARALPDPVLERIESVLPKANWRIARGPHVLIYHQADPADLVDRVETLERVVETYCLVLSAWGLSPSAPRERLVSVWFPDRPAYLDYLSQDVGGAFTATQGYYHPIRQIVFTYDTRDQDSFTKQASEIDAKKARSCA